MGISWERIEPTDANLHAAVKRISSRDSGQVKRLFVLSWSHPNGGPVVLKAYLYDPATNNTNKWTSRAGPPGVTGPVVNVQGRLFMPGIESSYPYTP